MREIALTQGKVALVDDADYAELVKYRWHASKSSDVGRFYAARFEKTNGKKHKIYMHRFLTDCPAGSEVDHRNNNSLDNRRSNFKVCSKSENISLEWKRKRK